MGTVSLTLPSDGQTIDASDVNNPLNTLAAEINGQLDNSNIKTGAAIDRSKIAGFTDGWESLGYAPTTVTALGNRSYTVVIPSVDTTTATSPGQRLKLPRTVTAPTQCTDLESGSSQYFSRASASVGAITFTDDFTVSAWVKLESYSGGYIVSRWNGTSGWGLLVNTDGTVQLFGTNAGASNSSYVKSYQSLPLNKWVHVAAQLDMNTFTATTTTSYVMIDGVNVPATVARSGTNPTALVQAGNLEIGSANGATFFDGKIAQVALYSAKVIQATILASMNQTLTGSETSLLCAYTFNNAVTDLSSNGYTLTANGGALATATDTPFTNPVTGTSITAGTTNYGIIMAQTFSTNTTYTIQIPEGETLPTTGGIGTVSYSTQKTPYGFPQMSNQVGYVLIGVAQTGITTETDVLGATITLSAPSANTKYRITYIGFQASNNANLQAILRLKDGSTELRQVLYSCPNTTNAFSTPTLVHEFTVGTAGSHTYKMTAHASGGGTIQAYASVSSNQWSEFIIEQVGLV